MTGLGTGGGPCGAHSHGRRDQLQLVVFAHLKPDCTEIRSRINCSQWPLWLTTCSTFPTHLCYSVEPSVDHISEQVILLYNIISYYGMCSVLIWLAVIKSDMAGMKIISGRRKCLSIWWCSWLENCRRKSWSCAWPWIHYSVTWIIRDHSKSRIKVNVSQWITWTLSFHLDEEC